MGFKLSDLKGWTVKRDVEIAQGHILSIEIAIKTRDEFEAIVKANSDLDTAKALIVDVSGLDDEKGKALPRAKAFEQIAAYPAIVMRLAAEAVDAQYQAAIKN